MLGSPYYLFECFYEARHIPSLTDIPLGSNMTPPLSTIFTHHRLLFD
ncbi:hypothetical protein NHJ6243_004876 [Beauveria neobassiana]